MTRVVTETVIIEVQDAEPIEDWAGWTHWGKTVQINRLVFRVKGGMLGGLEVWGAVLKKDGTPGSQTADYRLPGGWRGWDNPEYDGGSRIASQLQPYVELAREQLRLLESQG